MKYICLGYMDDSKFETMSESERNDFMDKCFAYDSDLQQKGHIIGGEALQRAQNAATVHFKSGSVLVTDGPFIETKEQIGGIMILEARDMNHVIQLISNHPSVLMGGSWEIRPADDISQLIAESERRRSTSR